MNKGKPHYLRQNDTTRFPKRLLFIDTETLPEAFNGFDYHRMRLAVTCYIELGDSPYEILSEDWHFFTTQSDVCSYIESLSPDKRPLWILASNPTFDLGASGFISHFTREHWRLDFYAQNGLVFILTIRKDSRKIKVMAMQNFLPTGIKGVGKMIGLQKLEVDVFTEDEDLLKIYCFRDTEILVEGFLYYMKYIFDNDLGGFAYTKSGQAMRAFRHRFMIHKILIHGNKELARLERSGYFGGRVECFRIGKQPEREYVQLDINSMYPTCMQKYDYPVKAKGFIQPGNLRHLGEQLRHYAVTARVLINTPEPAYPAYVNGRFLYPVGRFWCTLNTRGLLYALHHDHIESVSTGVYYLKEPIFRGYIDHFWHERQEAQKAGNRTKEQLIKLMLNSLYGKFAERHPVMSEEHDTENDQFSVEYWYDETTKEHGVTRTMFHKTQTFVEKEDAENSLVTVAAHVTEDARFLLWRLMKKAGLDNVYYVDTDSLIVTREIYETRLSEFCGVDLGQLKVEGVSNHLVIHTLKDYEFGEKVVLKGIKKRTVPNEDGSYTVPQFLTFSSLMREGVQDAALVRYVDKTLKRTYTKGIISSDLMVTPFHVDVPTDTEVFSFPRI